MSRIDRPMNDRRIPTDEAASLPITAIWSVISSFPLFIPSVLGDTAPFRIEDGVVIWFFGPFVLGIFQRLIHSILPSNIYSRVKSPVIMAYGIVGVVSATVHISVAWWAYQSSEITWSRIYIPNHQAVQPGPTIMTEGALIFIQYGYIVFNLCVLTLGVYMFGYGHTLITKSSAENPSAIHHMLQLIVITAFTGPGAGLAWLLCKKERDMDTPVVSNKQT